MISSIPKFAVDLSCIHQRACTGHLKTRSLVRFVKQARINFGELKPKPRTETNTGEIVSCFKCSRDLRKLAFYNYVSCGCGSVACYACGEDITYSVRDHPCPPVNQDREPQSTGNKRVDEPVVPSTSRRYRAHATVHSTQGLNVRRDTTPSPAYLTRDSLAGYDGGEIDTGMFRVRPPF